jgi:hypothetical protein
MYQEFNKIGELDTFLVFAVVRIKGEEPEIKGTLKQTTNYTCLQVNFLPIISLPGSGPGSQSPKQLLLAILKSSLTILTMTLYQLRV